MSLQPDSMLGPYRVVGLLGEGGMGAVYRAKDTRLGRDVAIKVLTTVTLNDTERLTRFEQEARATGMLNHPNLLTIYDVGNHDGTPYLVSELLEGETLRERLERGPLSPRKAIDAANQIAQGLAAAHEKGIVHRDLKPDNVFLTRDGRVKILDFGIAKLTGNSAEGAFQGAATEPGMVLGTVGYMSPEQVRGEAVDQRSDIFAFGTILYEALTGGRAFKRGSSIETLSAILKEDPPELSDTIPNVPQAVERLVRRCMEKDRTQRFQSARDLAFALETLSTLSSHQTLSGVVTPHVPTPPPLPATGSNDALTMRTTTPPPTATMRTPPAAQPTVRTPAPAAHPPTAARPAMQAETRAKRRVSPLLLALLYVVSIGGAAWGGWYFANRIRGAAGEAEFHRMTFRRGEVRSARFGENGDTIVYSAAWDGGPTQLYVANRNSPDARSLDIPDADVVAVSKQAELAVLLHRDRLSGQGTLARVPLAGGQPREVADGVLQAEWSPDGSQLAILRAVSGNFRIEYPITAIKYQTPHPIHELRLSHDGKKIAFIEPENGKNDVAVLDLNKPAPVTVAQGWEHGANGLAWSADDKELWLTGTATSAPPSLFAVNVDTGEPRLVSRLIGSMKLYDISAAGRVLLSNGTWRAALEYQQPGQAGEHDASWLDWSILADLSADGKTILFNETREGGGAQGAIYLRHADNPTPMRIGDGNGDALSPDGHWVLCHNGAKLVVLPTGSGEPRELKLTGAYDLGAQWLPDSRRVVLGGAQQGKGYQLHVIDTLDESDKPATPENIWGEAFRPFAVSPDGRQIAGMTSQATIAIYSLDGNTPPVAVASLPGEVPLQWSADGSQLYVYRPTAMPAQVFRVTLATGTRELWKQFSPADPAGVYKIAPICLTKDAQSYAYNALRTLTDLYVAEGLH